MKSTPILTSGSFETTIPRIEAAHLIRRLRRAKETVFRSPRLRCIYLPGFILHLR